MKKFLLFVCLAMACLFVLAQDGKKIDHMIGVEAGVDNSNIVGKDEKNDAVTGFQAGCYATLVRGKSYRLNAHLLYSMQGAKFGNDSRYVLNYLVLPILFNYMIARNLFVGAGLQPGLLLNAKFKLGGQSMDAKDYFKSFDVSLPVHLGYDITNQFGIGFYYTPGISDILDNNNGGSSARNSTLSLRINYRF